MATSGATRALTSLFMSHAGIAGTPTSRPPQSLATPPPAHPSSSSCLPHPILAPPQRARRPSRCAPRIIFALYSLRLLDCGASEAAEPGTDATCGCSGLAA